MDDKLKILYEDNNLLVVDKPSGLVVHSDGKTKEPTLVDLLLSKYPEMENIGEPWVDQDGKQISRPGIVHRLDRETSGALIVAKTQNAFDHLKKQFQERLVEKSYLAFVHGTLKEKEGIINRPIGKSRKDFRLWSAQRGARGELRDAVTEYKVIKQGEKIALLEISPKTGRTHQIRTHLKAIHHPVVCDSLYAPKYDCMGFSRLALHAHRVLFKDQNGKVIEVEATVPDEFVVAEKALS